MRSEISSTSPKTNTLSQTLAFYGLQCYTTRTPVRTALSPNAGLKDTHTLQGRDTGYVRTALSPNAGLKEHMNELTPRELKSQNSAKPERGIESLLTLSQQKLGLKSEQR